MLTFTPVGWDFPFSSIKVNFHGSFTNKNGFHILPFLVIGEYHLSCTPVGLSNFQGLLGSLTQMAFERLLIENLGHWGRVLARGGP